MFISVLGFSKKKMGGGERKKKWMFPLQHVTFVQLTAENNLGLQASGWMADANLLFSGG